MKTIYDYKLEYSDNYSFLRVFQKKGNFFFLVEKKDFYSIATSRIMTGDEYNSFINNFDYFIEEELPKSASILFLLLDESPQALKHNTIEEAYDVRDVINIDYYDKNKNLNEFEKRECISSVKNFLSQIKKKDIVTAYNEIIEFTGIHNLNAEDLFTRIISKTKFDKPNTFFHFYQK